LESIISKGQRDERLIFYVFDLLHLDSFDLRGCTLIDRKRVLQVLLEGTRDPIRYSEHFETDGAEFFRNACKLGFEGSVSKVRDSKYESGRTAVWTKTTCRKRDTFVVAGWAERRGKFDGLYLGRERKKKLVYAGKLERGFTEDDKKRILAHLEKLKTKKQPIEAARTFSKAKWVKPHVLVDAEFRGQTSGGLLRHPAFKGVRRDLME
jgi:bifunctional non-homologous end joining protein LigD